MSVNLILEAPILPQDNLYTTFEVYDDDTEFWYELPDSELITANIMNQGNLGQLLNYAKWNGDTLNPINWSAFFTKARQLLHKRTPTEWQKRFFHSLATTYLFQSFSTCMGDLAQFSAACAQFGIKDPRILDPIHSTILVSITPQIPQEELYLLLSGIVHRNHPNCRVIMEIISSFFTRDDYRNMKANLLGVLLKGYSKFVPNAFPLVQEATTEKIDTYKAHELCLLLNNLSSRHPSNTLLAKIEESLCKNDHSSSIYGEACRRFLSHPFEPVTLFTRMIYLHYQRKVPLDLWDKAALAELGAKYWPKHSQVQRIVREVAESSELTRIYTLEKIRFGKCAYKVLQEPEDLPLLKTTLQRIIETTNAREEGREELMNRLKTL